MACIYNKYKSTNVKCDNCVCNIPYAKQICMVQGDRKLHRKHNPNIFTIVFKNGMSNTTRNRDKDCYDSLTVQYIPERDQYIDQEISFVSPRDSTRIRTHRKRPFAANPTPQRRTMRFTTFTSSTDHQNKEICIQSSYKNAFYITLISVLVVLSCICLAIAAYFARKRLRRLRTKSPQILQSRPKERRLDGMLSENYSHYATIQDTFDITSTKQSPTDSEPHYAEPLIDDSLNYKTGTIRSFRTPRKTSMNGKFHHLESRYSLKLCNDEYCENTNQKISKESHDSHISEILKDGVCDSMLFGPSKSFSEYFKNEQKDSNVQKESSVSPELENEYFQLEECNKDNEWKIDESEDQIILGSESNEYSAQCAQDVSETTTPLLSVNEHLNSSTNVLTSMTDLQRTNDESSLIMQTEGNATDNRPHECHMESRSIAPDDGSGYFVLLKRRDFSNQQ